MPLPGGQRVDLELQRVQVLTDDSLLFVDAVPVESGVLRRELALWSGRVLGEPTSDAFVALSPWGTRGWVRTTSRLVHLLPDTGGTLRLMDERDLRVDDLAAFVPCRTVSSPIESSPALRAQRNRWETAARAAAHQTPATGASTQLPLLEGRVAFETDTALTQLFGDVADMLAEFSGLWGAGMAPVDADLYHFISGVNLLGGIANEFSACHEDNGFSVSSNLMGLTPVPITVSPLNWDYFIIAHELGHNIGAMHTHEYCPPLDSCSFSLGPCQTTQQCQTGTLMSYCYACPGGMLNIQDSFHPMVKSAIRFAVEERFCLRPYHGVAGTDLGDGLAGALGLPLLSVRDALPGGLALELLGLPHPARAPPSDPPTRSSRPSSAALSCHSPPRWFRCSPTRQARPIRAPAGPHEQQHRNQSGSAHHLVGPWNAHDSPSFCCEIIARSRR